MKREKDTQDYEQKGYDIVPEWVEDYLLDRLDTGIVISSYSGGYVRADEDDAVDLEEYR